MTNTSAYKSQIKRFIQLSGIQIDDNQHPPLCCCPEPSHSDSHPSAIIYDDNLWCPVCNAAWDIFDLAGLIFSVNTFPEKMNEVKRVLGEALPDTTNTQQKKENKPVTVSPVTVEKARSIFTREKLLGMSEFIGKKLGEKKELDLQGIEAQKYGYGDKITGNWAYKNDDGLIEIIDIRFEGGPKKKNVVSFYYDGKYVKSKSCPVKVYNRDLIKKYPDHIILIVEGAKSAKIAMCLLEFGLLPITWNGGTHKITMADWSCIYGRDVYFFPDDDNPGIKAAEEFKTGYKQFCKDIKVIPPYTEARKLKQHGADIEEVLQLLSSKECAEYILSSDGYKPPEPKRIESDWSKGEDPPAIGNDPPNQSHKAAFSDAPFRILGTAEDGYTYFIDQHGRIYTSKLDTLSRGKLNNLAPLWYWKEWIGTNKLTSDDWLECQNDIIIAAGAKDFDKENIRGRGAWREPNGDLCFHTGQKTIGNYSPDRVFLRKEKIDIGIGSKPLDRKIISDMKKAAFALSFETQVDAMRCLGFSILAPFSGALIWRPQGMLTGPSGAGKSSVEINIVKTIAIPDRFNGGKTSAAGYMQARKRDVGCSVIEEVDPDTETKKRYREDLLSIMRQSTSDDTPRSAMGTSDGSGTDYMTRDMIFFVCIDAEVSSVADDNRLTRINMVKPETGGAAWNDLRNELERVFTKENCRRLRSMTWDKLKDIISLSNVIATEIQKQTKKDHRFAISEGTIMAAYIIIWKGIENPTEKEIKDFVSGTYAMMEPEDRRDESEEIIELIYQEKVKVYLEGHYSELPIGDILAMLVSGKTNSTKDTDIGGIRDLTKEEERELTTVIQSNGIYIQDGLLGIASNHKEIKRILRRSSGYSRILRRHPKCEKINHNINRGRNQKCTMFDVLKDDFVPF